VIIPNFLNKIFRELNFKNYVTAAQKYLLFGQFGPPLERDYFNKSAFEFPELRPETS